MNDRDALLVAETALEFCSKKENDIYDRARKTIVRLKEQISENTEKVDARVRWTPDYMV